MTTTTAKAVAGQHAADDSVIGGMLVPAANANYAAVRALADGNHDPAILSRFCGWGAASSAVFFDYDAEISEDEEPIAYQLRHLLTQEQHAAAKASTLNAYYTPPWLIQEMWKLVAHLGFKGGRILEPSCGVLRFREHQPQEMIDRSEWVGVEAEHISAQIAQILYPDATVYHSKFENVTLPEDSFDLVIGNFPFGSDVPTDAVYNRDSRTIHSYFLYRCIHHLRPGGLLCVITGQGTLDSNRDASLRRWLSGQGELLLNARLHNNVHQGAGSSCDLLIFRKGDAPNTVPLWTQSLKPAGIAVNASYLNAYLRLKLAEKGAEKGKHEYLDADPRTFNFSEYQTSNVLGSLSIDTRYYNRIVANDDQRDMVAELARLRKELPKDIYAESDRDDSIELLSVEHQQVRPGTYLEIDGEIFVRGRLKLERPDPAKLPRIKAALALHAKFDALYQHERHSDDDEAAVPLREALKEALFEFYCEYGNLLSPVNQDAFGDDPRLGTLSTLERFNPDSGEIERSEFLEHRTVRPFPQPGKCDSAGAALAQCLDLYGFLDIGAIAESLDLTEDEAQQELLNQKLAFYDPDPDTMCWLTASEYLSGDVKTKLKQAEDAGLLMNAEALREVLPKPVLPPASQEIMLACAEALDIPIHVYSEKEQEKLFTETLAVNIKAPWLPVEVIHEFILHLLGNSVGEEDVRVHRIEYPSLAWCIEATTAAKHSQASTLTWGATAKQGFNLFGLLDCIFNVTSPIVKYEGVDGRMHTDHEATDLNRQKIIDIQEAFDGWLFSDLERAKQLTVLYNDTINRYRHRTFSGEHLTFPGSNPEITPYGHQKTGVWRSLTQQKGKGTLLGHCVGAGKSIQLAAICMEGRRLGMINKPVVVVQKDTLGSIVAEFQRFYPNARILYARNEEEVSGKNRQRFLDRIAFGDWDAIVVHHNLFFEMSMSEEATMAYLEEQIALHEQVLLTQKGKLTDQERRSIEKRKKGLEARVEKVTKSFRKKSGLTFEQLGVDAILLDESQVVKKLGFYSKLVREVRGIDAGMSQAAMDTKLKADYLLQRGGRVIFATGTPITNTLAEMFNLMQFLCPQTLKQFNMATFDAWAAMFTETETGPEIGADGTYKIVTRMTRFTNLPELMALFWDIADLVLREDLDLPVPKPHFFEEVTKPTPILEDYMDFLVYRAQRIQAKNPVKIPSASRKPKEEGYIVVLDEDGDPWEIAEWWIDKKAEPWQPGDTGFRFRKKSKWYTCDREAFYKHVQPSESDDMMLLVTGHGRQAALDPRMVEGQLVDHPGSKLNHAVWCIWQIWQETKAVKGTQMVFSSVGTPKYDGWFNVYEEMANKLAYLGIPRQEIAFVHDCKTSAERVTLFDQVKAGEVRILFGSTEKGGTGVNVQTRLVALHHMEPHWKPSDIEQREGRIIRQKNLWPEVLIFRHVCEGRQGSAGFDAFLWQKLKQKQTFISQVFRKELPSRHTEDLGETTLNFAQVMALASGSEILLEQAELQQEEKRLRTKAASVLAQAAATNSRKKKLQDDLDIAVAKQDYLDKEARLINDEFDGIVKIMTKMCEGEADIGTNLFGKLNAMHKQAKGGNTTRPIKIGHVPSTGHTLHASITFGKFYLTIALESRAQNPAAEAHTYEVSKGKGAGVAGAELVAFLRHTIPEFAETYRQQTKQAAKDLAALERQELPTFAEADRLNWVIARLRAIDKDLDAAEKAVAEEKQRQREQRRAELEAEGKTPEEIEAELDDTQRFECYNFRKARLYKPDPQVVEALLQYDETPKWLPLLRRLVSEFKLCDNSGGSTVSPTTVTGESPEAVVVDFAEDDDIVLVM